MQQFGAITFAEQPMTCDSSLEFNLGVGVDTTKSAFIKIFAKDVCFP